jgi:hypothetical protein
VVHWRSDEVDVVGARAMIYAIDRILEVFARHGAEQAPAFFMDWMGARAPSADARRYMQDKAKSNLQGVSFGGVTLASGVGPAARMTLQVLGMVIGAVVGAPMRIVPSRDELMTRYAQQGFEAPKPDPEGLEEIQLSADAVDYVRQDPN